MTEELNLHFGLTDSSKQRFRDLQGRFQHIDEIATARMLEFIDALAIEVEGLLIAEFRAGTDSMGITHDKTGATIDTFHVETRGMDAEITMGGGASFVEYGRPEVTPQNAKVLHWIDPFSEEDIFAMSSSAVEPDDFVGRAIHEDLDMQHELSKLALGFQHDLTRTGEYGTSISKAP